MRQLFLLFFCLQLVNGIYAQSNETLLDKENDSIIYATPEDASDYIQRLIDDKNVWISGRDSFRLYLSRLLQHVSEPYDSIEKKLMKIEYDSIKIREAELIRRDTLKLIWLNDSTFVINKGQLEREPFIRQTIITKTIHDTIKIVKPDSISLRQAAQDSMAIDTISANYLPARKRSIKKTDTISVSHVRIDTSISVHIDTAYLDSRSAVIHRLEEGKVIPSFLTSARNKTWWFVPDSSKIIVAERYNALIPTGKSSFYIIPDVKMPDSLQRAVETLVSYAAERDSILIYFTDFQGNKVPFWLTAGDDELYRYWVKNYQNDSITVWMGNPVKNELTMLLEQNVNLQRLQKELVFDTPVIRVEPEIKLAEIKPLKEIPVYWSYNFSTAFSLNQTYLSNWAKGGENSFSSLLDMQGTAKYKDTKAKIEWTNNARLKFGTLITEEFGLRTNADMFEINSQYNKVLIEKLDFSTVFYMKNQLAKGYKFPNDSVVVSRFLNPGTFTIGTGFEYKPFEKTSLNFSPLSYKNTFVLDTANIDQTKHGIESDKRARQEMGGQLLIKNTVTLFEDLKISNKIRLFSGYLNKPQNIDVDWEIDIEKKISYYFTVSLNLHMIYDDDIRFPVLDENDKVIKLPDGSDYKVPRLQFKQFLGLTFLFKF